MAVYPPIAPSTFRWFRLPTGHGPATLTCHAVEPPTTRQIGDSPTFNRVVIGVWSVGYRKHRTLISGSSADDWSGSGQNLFERGGSDQMSTVTPVIILPPTYQWRISLFSHGQVSCVSCYLTVIVRHFSDELRWSPDENVLPCSVPPVSCYYQITYRLLRSHSASNVPAPSLLDKLKCVRPIFNEIGRKWKIRFPTSFRPATGLCGRGGGGHNAHYKHSLDLTILRHFMALYPEIFPDSNVHGAHLGPVGPRWAPCRPHGPCYLGCLTLHWTLKTCPNWSDLRYRIVEAPSTIWPPRAFAVTHTPFSVHRAKRAKSALRG